VAENASFSGGIHHRKGDFHSTDSTTTGHSTDSTTTGHSTDSTTTSISWEGGSTQRLRGRYSTRYRTRAG
jgi:hypothetical protein